MNKAKSLLVLIILLALTAKTVWWTVEDWLPYLGVIFLLLMLYGWIFRKKW
jgi:hypothetical protein